VAANSSIDSSEADFGRIPDLTDKSVDLIQAKPCPALIGATPTMFEGTAADTTAAWCEHGLLVRIEGPRTYVRSVVADLKVNVEPNA
jgi:hypothetical protein